MPVFISHRKADAQSALKVYAYLKSENIKSYVDELDDALQSANNITQVIMSRIKECTHMIAIMSVNTKGSWWVPFEIGVASEANRRISSYKTDTITVPEYLEIWPIMTQPEQLKQFVYLYKNDKLVLSESLSYSERIKASSAYVQSAADFHRKLKSSTGQI